MRACVRARVCVYVSSDPLQNIHSKKLHIKLLTIYDDL